MSSSRWSGRGRVRNMTRPRMMYLSWGGERTRGTSTRWRPDHRPRTNDRRPTTNGPRATTNDSRPTTHDPPRSPSCRWNCCPPSCGRVAEDTCDRTWHSCTLALVFKGVATRCTGPRRTTQDQPPTINDPGPTTQDQGPRTNDPGKETRKSKDTGTNKDMAKNIM